MKSDDGRVGLDGGSEGCVVKEGSRRRQSVRATDPCVRVEAASWGGRLLASSKLSECKFFCGPRSVQRRKRRCGVDARAGGEDEVCIGFQAAGRMQSRGLDKGQAQMPKSGSPAQRTPAHLHPYSQHLAQSEQNARSVDLILFPFCTCALAVASDCQGVAGGLPKKDRVTSIVIHA